LRLITDTNVLDGVGSTSLTLPSNNAGYLIAWDGTNFLMDRYLLESGNLFDSVFYCMHVVYSTAVCVGENDSIYSSTTVIFGPYYRVQLYSCTILPELSSDTRIVCSTDAGFTSGLIISMLQVIVWVCPR
jgi:hypothetical protein